MCLSDVSEFLVLPSTSINAKKSKTPRNARVLTSEQSLAIMKEKEQKKKEEEEAKQKRKQEREEKKVQREADKKKKAEERELKAIERKRKAAEAEAERERKRKERELKALEKQKMAEEKHKQKELKKGKQPFIKVFTTRSKSGYAPQHSESGSDECMLCFGNYSDDLEVSADGTPTRSWVECTSCKKWMHEDCAATDEKGNFVCVCVCVWCCVHVISS